MGSSHPTSDIIAPIDDRNIRHEPKHRKTRELMALEHRQTMTVEEYFLLERNDPDARYEYVDGHIYAMAGGTFNHDTIKSNIQRILWGCSVVGNAGSTVLTSKST